jgi:hypothetical protein
LLFFVEFAEQVGRVVRIHLLDDVGGAFGAEVVDDRLLRFGVEMLERVGGRFVVERPTTRAASRAERSPMISARSEGCSRARRCSETESGSGSG